MNNDKNYFFFFSTLFHLHQPELFVDSSEEMPNLQNKKKKYKNKKVYVYIQIWNCKSPK